MRILIPLLVAGALMPVAASAQDGGFRTQRGGGERASSSNDRSRPMERAQRVERSSGNDRAMRIERAERPVRTERNVTPAQSAGPVRQLGRAERGGSVQAESQARSNGSDQSAQPVEGVRRTERNGEFAIRRVPREMQSSSENHVQTERQLRRAERNQAIQPAQRVRSTEGSDGDFAIRRVPVEMQANPETQVQVQRDGDRDGFSGLHDRIVEHGDRNGDHHRWSAAWRYDHRYDWRNYRSRNGSLYRFGRYYDPYGWGYHRCSVGFNLWPSYYGSSFWLNDPWYYRLPPAYGPYRWVHYYNDVMLVNIYTGQVIDVVHNFFW